MHSVGIILLLLDLLDLDLLRMSEIVFSREILLFYYRISHSFDLCFFYFYRMIYTYIYLYNE